MKVHYTGKLERLGAAQERKLEARWSKLGKLLDWRSEKEAHVILTTQRHLQNAEITVNFYDHPLVGVSAAADGFTALLGAIEKLEKQILRQRARWRELRRTGGAEIKQKKAAESAARHGAELESEGPRVFRNSKRVAPKPMTVEEAVLEMDNQRDYVVYRDAETDRLSVLLRRRDGNYDLIEA